MEEFLRPFRESDRDTMIVLLATCILPVLYMYPGNHGYFEQHFAGWVSDPTYLQWASYGWQFAWANVLFVVVPILLITLVHRHKLTDYGFGLGDWRFGLAGLAICLPLCVPVLWIGSNDPEILATYPLVKLAARSTADFLGWTATYLTFYVAWEAMFRGYVQFGLRKGLGDVGAIGVQTLATTLLHYDKPFAETFSAIFAGIGWGAYALRTRSFWYVMVFHWVFGMCNDLFSVLRGG